MDESTLLSHTLRGDIAEIGGEQQRLYLQSTSTPVDQCPKSLCGQSPAPIRVTDPIADLALAGRSGTILVALRYKTDTSYRLACGFQHHRKIEGIGHEVLCDDLPAHLH